MENCNTASFHFLNYIMRILIFAFQSYWEDYNNVPKSAGPGPSCAYITSTHFIISLGNIETILTQGRKSIVNYSVHQNKQTKNQTKLLAFSNTSLLNKGSMGEQIWQCTQEIMGNLDPQFP